jgi:UDP-N-acetylglucosamine 2-epimerase (non-hydrolysing)
MTAQARRILAVVGTRPEGIKMAPVIRALRAVPWAEVRVLSTAQHRELLDQVLALFDITPDLDLDLMQQNQTLAGLTARLVARIDEVLDAERPDCVLAQGDTTTVFVAALVSFYRDILFGHVEAGLRTGDRRNPFPEEMNRVFAGYLGDLHFAPTMRARDHLLAEGVAEEKVFLTGNTVIDALHYQRDRLDGVSLPIDGEGDLILVTAHRRENFGAPFLRVCRAIRQVVDDNPKIQALYPVHPNPNVAYVARRELGDHPRIHLCSPLDYQQFVAAMDRARLILSDSGGVQEEAPALGKPVLVLREETERPEAVDAGVVALVGTDEAKIVTTANRLLQDPAAYAAMARGVSPYGDGHAAARIIEALRARLLGAPA